MLLEHGEKGLKYLEVVDKRDGRCKFVDNGKATEEEKQNLIDLDAYHFDLYGYHMIINLEDLQTDYCATGCYEN